MKASFFFTYNELSLEYIQFGSGPIPLLAFHGFGRHASDFEVFEQEFSKKYTIYAFNLFHHGNSIYPEHRIEHDSVSKTELKALFQNFLNEKSIETFSVMGYSLGGKIALMFPEFFPNELKEVWLFAPDGVKMNFWYFVASKTFIGRKIYKYFLNHPQLFYSMVDNLNSVGVLNDKLKKFALNNMNEKEKRELVYRVWLTFKETNPNMNVVIRNILNQNIQVYQYFGKNDKVITPNLGRWFSAKINQKENYHVLRMGHNLLNNKTVEIIKSQGHLDD